MKRFLLSTRRSLVLLILGQILFVHCDEGKQGDIFHNWKWFNNCYSSSCLRWSFQLQCYPDELCWTLVSRSSMQPWPPPRPSGGVWILLCILMKIQICISRGTPSTGSTTPWWPVGAPTDLGQLLHVLSLRTERGGRWRIPSTQGEWQ